MSNDEKCPGCGNEDHFWSPKEDESMVFCGECGYLMGSESMMRATKYEMFIEGDGATDQYGLRIHSHDSSYVVQGISRKDMNYLLKDLVDQFLSLTSDYHSSRWR